MLCVLNKTLYCDNNTQKCQCDLNSDEVEGRIGGGLVHVNGILQLQESLSGGAELELVQDIAACDLVQQRGRRPVGICGCQLEKQCESMLE